MCFAKTSARCPWGHDGEPQQHARHEAVDLHGRRGAAASRRIRERRRAPRHRSAALSRSDRHTARAIDTAGCVCACVSSAATERARGQSPFGCRVEEGAERRYFGAVSAEDQTLDEEAHASARWRQARPPPSSWPSKRSAPSRVARGIRSSASTRSPSAAAPPATRREATTGTPWRFRSPESGCPRVMPCSARRATNGSWRTLGRGTGPS